MFPLWLERSAGSEEYPCGTDFPPADASRGDSTPCLIGLAFADFSVGHVVLVVAGLLPSSPRAFKGACCDFRDI